MFQVSRFSIEAPHTESVIRRSGQTSTPENRPPPPRLCPFLTPGRLWFVVPPMNISNAIHLVRETCALRHFSIKTEKTYVYWLGRYGTFLKDQPDQRLLSATSEQKMEAFLTRLAREGMAASTQNQAFNAV